MELIYPFVLYIGIIAVFILCVIKLKKKAIYKDGTKIANTKYAKSVPYYDELMKKYKILSFSIKAICIVCICASLVLLSRPAKIETTSTSKYNRDIMLCLDTSTSVDNLNLQLISNYKDIVENLKGERFGISIFNTSSVLLVPLTDDYEYVLETLDMLEKCIENSINITENYEMGIYDTSDESMFYEAYLRNGTGVGEGSSLIGDGLASCVFDFPDIEEDKERTRIIIFSTDNDLNGTPTVSLTEAAEISKENNVTVFGIAPKEISDDKSTEMKNAMELTGGEYYEEASSGTVDSIVDNIEQEGKALIEVKEETRKIDRPMIPFIILLISIFILFLLDKKVKL